MWKNQKSIEAAIKRLTAEIEEIDDFFYKGNENDGLALLRPAFSFNRGTEAYLYRWKFIST
jgi:hypothetical protein